MLEQLDSNGLLHRCSTAELAEVLAKTDLGPSRPPVSTNRPAAALLFDAKVPFLAQYYPAGLGRGFTLLVVFLGRCEI
jgi:hypothetical protein